MDIEIISASASWSGIAEGWPRVDAAASLRVARGASVDAFVVELSLLDSAGEVLKQTASAVDAPRYLERRTAVHESLSIKDFPADASAVLRITPTHAAHTIDIAFDWSAGDTDAVVSGQRRLGPLVAELATVTVEPPDEDGDVHISTNVHLTNTSTETLSVVACRLVLPETRASYGRGPHQFARQLKAAQSVALAPHGFLVEPVPPTGTGLIRVESHLVAFAPLTVALPISCPPT